MTKCPICYNVYGDWRSHCPACGAGTSSHFTTERYTQTHDASKWHPELVAANGCERARQLPQSPRWFEYCDCDQ